MISKFSVLYVGQIELDNVGRHSTPADARRYPNERLVEAYHTARDIAQHMDELGYYCLWPRSASCAMRTPRAGRGARRAPPRACRPSAMGWTRRPGSAALHRS